jgi:transposase-like protein
MKKRKWTGQQKLQIVIDGLSGKRSVSELCMDYEISQSLYYKWRDQLLAQGNTVFDTKPDKKVSYLESKVKRLTNLVGELTIDLKKTEQELEWLE